MPARYVVRLRLSAPSQAAHTFRKAAGPGRRRWLFGHDLISIVVFFMDLALARPVLDLVLNSLTVALLRSVVVCSQFVQTERLASIASTRSPGLCRPISLVCDGRWPIGFAPSRGRSSLASGCGRFANQSTVRFSSENESQ